MELLFFLLAGSGFGAVSGGATYPGGSIMMDMGETGDGVEI